MSHRIILTVTAMLLSLIAVAQGWNQDEYDRIEQAIVRPTFHDTEFDIRRYGASPDASAKQNQKAINKAIHKCSRKGGKVIIPAGEWHTGAIRLQDNVNLVISEGATLKFAFEPELYPLVRTAWEGMECVNYSPCIYAFGAKNIAITGKGTIDGNGNNSTWWKWNGAPRYGYVEGVTTESQKLGARTQLMRYAEDGVPAEERIFGMGHGLRPQLIGLMQCENILVEGVTLVNSPFWTLHPLQSRNITVDGVSFINDGPNGDGCNPEACENVLIQNCMFRTGDDCIAIKSGRNNDGRMWKRPSQNIIIRNCRMEDGHGGVVIGSEISGGCRNVYAENCEMDSPNLDRVLRIKTNNCRGGVVENINMRNVTVGQCREAVLKINLNYESHEDCYRGYQPIVRRVSMQNVTCQKSKYGILISSLDSIANVHDINVKDCRFDGVTTDPVKITGKTENIKFDNLFINQSLILDEASRPYQNYSQWMVMSEMQRNPDPTLLDFSKRPKWSYVMGIELESMLDTYLAYGNDSILRYLQRYPDTMIDAQGNITGYRLEDYNIDQVRTAKFIYRMYQRNPQPQLLKAMRTIFRQLEEQPRTNEGVWWHKAIYANQVWLDGIFMGLPYYTLSAPTVKGDGTKYWQDAIAQITKTDRRTYDPKTELWKHAWDETQTAFWADSTTGLSRHTWARAMGWYVMAMIEVLDAIPESTDGRTEVIRLLQRAMTSVVKYQDKRSGVWYDVLDVNNERNYLESTASCMFAYVLLKGARMGYLSDDFRTTGIRAYEGILREFIRTNADSTISLTRCCQVSGLGPAPGPYVKKPNFRRDGSFNYYMSEPIRDNDAKGIGPFIWASLEYERLKK